MTKLLPCLRQVRAFSTSKEKAIVEQLQELTIEICIIEPVPMHQNYRAMVAVETIWQTHFSHLQNQVHLTIWGILEHPGMALINQLIFSTAKSTIPSCQWVVNQITQVTLMHHLTDILVAINSIRVQLIGTHTIQSSVKEAWWSHHHTKWQNRRS